VTVAKTALVWQLRRQH